MSATRKTRRSYPKELKTHAGEHPAFDPSPRPVGQTVSVGTLEQTFTLAPGYVGADTERCDGCGVRVTRRSLEVFQPKAGGERWLCVACARASRKAVR